MAPKYDNLNDSQIPDLIRRIERLERASPMNNSAIGRGGIEVYDGGTINVSSGNLIVNGTATVSGVLNADGTVTLSGTVGVSGPLTVSGATGITGPLTVAGITNLDGPTTIAGNTSVTGTLTTNGPLDVNGTTTLDGNTTATGTLTTNGPLVVNGAAEVNGNLDVDGTMRINGASTLNNTLTVASGRKITLGGLTLENQSASSGQVQFPGGGISASASLGMLITHGTVEIAGTTVKISSLPTTSEPANLYADSSGRLYRSTAA